MKGFRNNSVVVDMAGEMGNGGTKSLSRVSEARLSTIGYSLYINILLGDLVCSIVGCFYESRCILAST